MFELLNGVWSIHHLSIRDVRAIQSRQTVLQWMVIVKTISFLFDWSFSSRNTNKCSLLHPSRRLRITKHWYKTEKSSKPCHLIGGNQRLSDTSDCGLIIHTLAREQIDWSIIVALLSLQGHFYASLPSSQQQSLAALISHVNVWDKQQWSRAPLQRPGICLH